ncbi:RNA polymerase, sigma 28 subunit, SigD/FliA/WhiG [Ferrimonas sediminum]|uniref:RNA polymerase sigma factor FliA n=1 Tax=Ferrimonas sediminum TaxID=718193 RepID=A0A1G8YWV3_9GAMM|nr:RNA polymerase sigma factor FliA [Ferrimonas sediminum]SDK07339.1 RNA polymerase, sigma 28 subunit, SigD/FliA/WhiG [Ferrimonas sediminum]
MNKAAAYTQFDNRTSLVERYAPLVKRIAHHLMARLPASVQLDDLLQSGMIGLLEASRNFDGSKGASFETFAGIRIRGAMLDEIRRGDWVPRSVHRNYRQVTEAISELEKRLGRDPRDTEVAAHLDVPVADYHQMLNEASMGRMVGIEDLGVPADSFVDEDAPQRNFEQVAQERFQQALSAAIKTLPEREALVLSLYYDEELNLKEIGQVLGVSESRVSQINSQAMMRLKSRLSSWQQ